MLLITQLDGTEKRLYSWVGPLVMDPEVLKKNYNYPFKTSQNYEWLVATDAKKVVGFMPIEKRSMNFIINNYYVPENREDVLESLLVKAIDLFSSQVPLVAVAFTEHEKLFETYGFVVEKRWKLYVKMRKSLMTNE
ncbi:MAG: hypothetical protein LIP08_01935 [Bacteroides sp.]|nr:hypothetical protein [Bacteroides sp.]